MDNVHVIDEGVHFRGGEGLGWNAKEATDGTDEVECSEVTESFDAGCGGIGGILKSMGGDAGRAREGGAGEGPGEAAASVLDGAIRRAMDSMICRCAVALLEAVIFDEILINGIEMPMKACTMYSGADLSIPYFCATAVAFNYTLTASKPPASQGRAAIAIAVDRSGPVVNVAWSFPALQQILDNIHVATQYGLHERRSSFESSVSVNIETLV